MSAGVSLRAKAAVAWGLLFLVPAPLAAQSQTASPPAIQVSIDGATVKPGATIPLRDTPLASTSDPIVVTIANTGGSPLVLNEFAPPQLYGDASMMYLLDTSALSSTIVPGSNTSFSVTFFPYQTGEADVTLVITTNDPATPKFTIRLRAKGLPMSDP